MKLIAIDPGHTSSGVAEFDHGGELATAYHRKGEDLAGLLALRDLRGWRVIIEQAAGQGGRAPAAALLKLQLLVGALKHSAWLAGAKVELVTANGWKGGTPKEITRARAEALLSPEEIARVESSKHDTWDAIAVGLVRLGRAGLGVVPQ